MTYGRQLTFGDLLGRLKPMVEMKV